MLGADWSPCGLQAQPQWRQRMPGASPRQQRQAPPSRAAPPFGCGIHVGRPPCTCRALSRAWGISTHAKLANTSRGSNWSKLTGGDQNVRGLRVQRVPPRARCGARTSMCGRMACRPLRAPPRMARTWPACRPCAGRRHARTCMPACRNFAHQQTAAPSTPSHNSAPPTPPKHRPSAPQATTPAMKMPSTCARRCRATRTSCRLSL